MGVSNVKSVIALQALRYKVPQALKMVAGTNMFKAFNDNLFFMCHIL